MNKTDEHRFFDSDGHLAQWPSKNKDKRLVLAYLATKFDERKTYSETEVNALLKQWHTFNDWPLLRRELFDGGFLDRNLDGSNYYIAVLKTNLSGLDLLVPNVERDAPAGVRWLAGSEGRNTLRLMGNTDEQNQPSTLEEEHQRMRDFITATDQTTWMMRYNGVIVGAVWLSLEPTEYLGAPSIHIMIGDPEARGKGIGISAITAIITLIKARGAYEYLYSRYLLENEGSAKLLAKCGFTPGSKPYRDKDGLSFQNVKLLLKGTM